MKLKSSSDGDPKTSIIMLSWSVFEIGNFLFGCFFAFLSGDNGKHEVPGKSG